MREFVRKAYPIQDANQIPSGTVGAYILSKDGRNPNYIGRSDTDLGSEIKNITQLHREYTHFFFEVANSPYSAYITECKWYHAYPFLDNTEHPKPPHGLKTPCPICHQLF